MMDENVMRKFVRDLPWPCDMQPPAVYFRVEPNPGGSFLRWHVLLSKTVREGWDDEAHYYGPTPEGALRMALEVLFKRRGLNEPALLAHLQRLQS